MPGLRFVALFIASVFNLLLSEWSDLGKADKIGAERSMAVGGRFEQGGVL